MYIMELFDFRSKKCKMIYFGKLCIYLNIVRNYQLKRYHIFLEGIKVSIFILHRSNLLDKKCKMQMNKQHIQQKKYYKGDMEIKNPVLIMYLMDNRNFARFYFQNTYHKLQDYHNFCNQNYSFNMILYYYLYIFSQDMFIHRNYFPKNSLRRTFSRQFLKCTIYNLKNIMHTKYFSKNNFIHMINNYLLFTNISYILDYNNNHLK